MDKKGITQIKEMLLEINAFVMKLDPSIRTAAFDTLQASYFGSKASTTSESDGDRNTGSGTKVDDAPTGDLGAFISTYEHTKPADNVMLLAAWLYSQYGASPITTKEIKELGDSCGLTIPHRPDNTMKQAKNKGKGLFTQHGKGFQLTVSGELFVKETYKVKKGNKAIPKE